MAKITVMDWQRCLLFTDGRFTRVLEPGRHTYRPSRCVTHMIDMRPTNTAVPGQELLTSDGVTLRVSALVVWRVADPLVYVTSAVNPEQMLYAAVQIALRDSVATTSFDDAITDRGRLQTGLLEATTAQLAGLGMALTSVVVKDLMLPGELRRAATETVVAREEGRADLERARAEAASLRALANVAKLLEDHPGLLHLRTIQAAAEPGTTLVLTPDAWRVPQTPR